MLPLIPMLTALITGKEFIKAVKTHVSEGVDVASVSSQSLPAATPGTELPPRA